MVYLLEELLREALEPRLKVRSQAPVILGDYTQAAPDVSVITLRQDGYRHRLPGADDIMLVVEVAETVLSPRSTRQGADARYREFWLMAKD